MLTQNVSNKLPSDATNHPSRGRMVSYLPPKLIVLPYLGMANYHQSLVEMVEHNRIKLVWVPGYMGFDGNGTVQN